ncbi:MAG TPA: DUF4147 domain-containing protein [Gallionella sp.]
MSKTIIITDLDGTLLDAARYSFEPALPALKLVRASGIPLILCSSKTRAEMEVVRTQLGNDHPFIVENGGGLFIPQGYFTDTPGAADCGGYRLVAFGTPYAEIRRGFIALRDALGARVRGFGDMTADEVSALTGLGLEDARRAQQRDFDEPFVFDSVPDAGFLRGIAQAGLNWTEGRLFHLMGSHDKGRAVSLLKSLYVKHCGATLSIGLGDSLNDLPLLQAVDRPVLVRRDDGGRDARIAVPCLIETQRPGPAGWNEVVLRLLSCGGPLREIFDAALAAVDPYRAVAAALRVEGGALHAGGERYDLGAFDRIIVVGAGKATARMAQAVEALLGARISVGLIVVKQGHGLPLETVEQVEAAHPVPDAAGAEATGRVLDMVRAADGRTLVLCLLSGGGSALLVAPAEGITLQDKQQTTGLLLKAGAGIDELNAVRKHLSAVKGGLLARAAYPAQVLTLLLSDVVGDRLDVIASGPTAPDGSRFIDALAVVAKYRLEQRLPPRVIDRLNRGAAGRVDETVKAGDRCFARTRNLIVGGLGPALDAAVERAGQAGLAARILTAGLAGDVRAAARFLAQSARDTLSGMRPGERLCLVSGGETTVAVTGHGKGGRNQELALAFALEIDGLEGVALLSAGTDGSDGPTDAAGALVDGRTAAMARALGIDPERYLEDNDSYSFFRACDAGLEERSHLFTGPTGTNVMDMQLLLLERKE